MEVHVNLVDVRNVRALLSLTQIVKNNDILLVGTSPRRHTFTTRIFKKERERDNAEIPHRCQSKRAFKDSTILFSEARTLWRELTENLAEEESIKENKMPIK